MALELVAAIVAAISFAGIALLLGKLMRGRLPKWAITVAAAVGLIGTTIWLEYDWFGRVSAELPEGFAVVDAQAAANPLRPWTYLAPITTRFSAIDATKIARHPEQAGLVMAPVYGFARWQNPQNALMVFDCAGKRRVVVTEGMEIAADGTLTGADWTNVETEDELQKAACQEE
jgi:hypothetical protein